MDLSHASWPWGALLAPTPDVRKRVVARKKKPSLTDLEIIMANIPESEAYIVRPEPA
jgi:hypothetical protein